MGDGVSGFLRSGLVIEIGLEGLGFVRMAAVFDYSVWRDLLGEPGVGHSELTIQWVRIMRFNSICDIKSLKCESRSIE